MIRRKLGLKSKPFPNGLSNNHGQVGRHYFSHNQVRRVTALFPRDLNNWYGLPAQGVAVDDWADDNFDHSRPRLHRRRQPVGLLRPPADRAPPSMNTFGRAPRWGSAWKAFVKENADRWNTAYLQKTTLPYEDNYLDLDPDGEGSARLPGVPHHRRLQGQRAEGRRRSSRTRWCEWSWRPAPSRPSAGRSGTMGPSTHAYGGTRMGDNPETNVVNRWGFSHEAPNLGILGASVMGTSGARNPTLTAQALAWRTAEHLQRELEHDRELNRATRRGCGDSGAATICAATLRTVCSPPPCGEGLGVGVARLMHRCCLISALSCPGRVRRARLRERTSSGTQRKARAAPYPLQQPHIMSPLVPALARLRSLGRDTRAPRPTPCPASRAA